MASGISTFLSTFTTDVARPSRFDVNIPIPLSLATYISTARNLTFRCESASLPGRTLATTAKKIGSAPVEYFPYHTDYQQSQMTFIVSDSMEEKLFFDTWMELINPTSDYNFQYKSNYTSDISINQYGVSNALTYSGVLLEAFPIDVSQMELDWSSVDSYHKLTVVFVYKQWQNTTVSSLRNNIKTGVLTGINNLL
jgi:hypothetical protein